MILAELVFLIGAKVAASLHGCFLGNNQRKVSCWEDGLGKKILNISTAGGIAFPEVGVIEWLKATVDMAKLSICPVPEITARQRKTTAKSKKS